MNILTRLEKSSIFKR